MKSPKEIRTAVAEAVKPTIMDWVLLPFSPKLVRERMQERAFMAVAGGYHGASKSRRSVSEWIAGDGDADSDQLPDLPALRERSRDLARNSALATGAINTKVTNVIGAGLKLNAQIDAEVLGIDDETAEKIESAFEREWRLFSESEECDIERTLKFNAMANLTYRSVLESGDIFINMPYIERPGSPFGLKLQLIEADRVANEDFQADSDRIAGGVERDEHGAPVAYHVLNKHPGNYRTVEGHKWQKLKVFNDETGRRQVLHLFRKIRPGQSRGIPDLAPVIEQLKQLERYTEAEIMAAVISSFFTVFVKSEAGSALAPMGPYSETSATSADSTIKLASGAIVDLAPGEDIETADPNRPNTAFDPFVQAVMRQIGVALELPFELLIKHFTASYSAARAAMLEAWKFFSERRQWLATELYQPVYEAVITEAVLSGRVKAPGFVRGDEFARKAYFGAEWIGPPQGQINPKDESEADKMQEDAGWVTLASNAAKRGNDWRAVTRQQLKEAKARKEIMELKNPIKPDDENDDTPVEDEDEDGKTEDKTED